MKVAQVQLAELFMTAIDRGAKIAVLTLQSGLQRFSTFYDIAP